MKILLMLLMFCSVSHAEDAAVPAATPNPESTSPAAPEYEVDYEEEPEAEEPEEVVPVKKTARSKKNAKVPEVQGSRAEKKFAPLYKSETKSFYKKNGKPLDVDTD